MPLGTGDGSSVRRNYGTTVATVADLRAVTLAERFSNQLVYVSGVDATYEFEPASVAVDDGDLILEPDDSPATGRWEKRGAGIVAPANHAANHVDGTDDIQSATAAQKGVATAAQITKLDAIEALADVTGTNAPQAHAASHTDGSDDIQDATAGQKGVATAAQITKLDAIEALADVTGTNTPQDHAAGHTDGSDDIQDATAGQKGVATAAQITKLDAIAALADVTGSNAPQAHAASHTDGGDDIQNATAAQKGVATAAQITKLDAIEALADVTGTNTPQDHAAGHVTGGGDVIADAIAAGDSGLLSGTDKTKLDGLGGGETVNTVSTTDGTLTTIATIPIADDSVNLIEARCLARRTNGDAGAGYIRRAVVVRRAGGSALLVGTEFDAFTREDESLWDFRITVSGNNALLRVVGFGGHSVDWTSYHDTPREIT